MNSARNAQRLVLALIGTVAAVTAPLSVSTPAWAATTTSTTTTVSAQPTQGQWKQLDRIAAAHSALGVADSGSVLRLAAGTSAVQRAKVAAQLPAGAKTVVRTSRFSQSKLSRIQKTVTARDWNSDADKYGVATSYDPATDKVVVYTNAPTSVTKSLSTTYPGALDVEQSRLEAQNTRFGDAQPFWGGVALVASENSNAYKCTAGFTVKERATGNLYMTTAGHCYTNLTHVYNRRTDDSSGNWVGQINRRNQNIDTEMIYASSSVSYGTDIWTGGSAASGTHSFVHGTEAAALGDKVCVSGSVSFNHCGHPISNTAFSICYTGGVNCIKNGQGFLYDRGGSYPSYDNGQITQGGDSGAPIYTEDYTSSAAWIVGSHSGIVYQGEDACGCSKPHMVGVKIGAIVSNMGVDVVTR
ncbi:S1 family peptidase [Streptomyces sp. NBC_01288]|uniref:hypothetical protein n=1 Tax=Streptomyces sp. NBC_01288 TaxID=2903814 RepID=UPI002E1270BA|nr:S1 family peptidase [Streptomyces sp. NBC_01288]